MRAACRPAGWVEEALGDCKTANADKQQDTLFPINPSGRGGGGLHLLGDLPEVKFDDHSLYACRKEGGGQLWRCREV